jgi:hypothetical protein
MKKFGILVLGLAFSSFLVACPSSSNPPPQNQTFNGTLSGKIDNWTAGKTAKILVRIPDTNSDLNADKIVGVNVGSDGSFSNLVFPVPTRIDYDFGITTCGTGATLSVSASDARVAAVGFLGTDFEIINSKDSFSQFSTVGTVYFGNANTSVMFYYANKAVTVNGTCPASDTNIIATTWNNVALGAGWNYLVITASSQNNITVTGTSLPTGMTLTFTGDASKL